MTSLFASFVAGVFSFSLYRVELATKFFGCEKTPLLLRRLWFDFWSFSLDRFVYLFKGLASSAFTVSGITSYYALCELGKAMTLFLEFFLCFSLF